MAFDTQEIIYYAVVWVIGSLSGLARFLRDREYRDISSCVGSVFSSGLFAFGVVGLWIGRGAVDDSGAMYFLAIASLVGYLSKEQDKIARWIIKGGLKRAGIIIEENEENTN